MLDYKYRGASIRERWREMTGENDSTVGFLVRILAGSFCVYTTLDPTASYYMSPLMWVLVWGFIYFYM
jgi:hypothetical protein